MNYIAEMNAFMNWLDTNPLDATTQALWFHIMAIANKSGWPKDFTIANLTLMAKINVSENTLNKHRNILIQKGRIEYKNQGKQKAGKYRLIPFTSNNEAKVEVRKESTSNNEVNHEVKHEVKCEVNPSALYKLNKTKLNDINTSTSTEKDDLVFDEEFSELAKLYQQVIGQPNALTPDWIDSVIQKYGFDWVKNAMLEAESRGKRTKKYIEGILGNWKANGGMKLSTDKNNTQSKTVQPKKTKFHNFEGRTDKYTAEQLEDVAERKRREHLEKLRKQSEAL